MKGYLRDPAIYVTSPLACKPGPFAPSWRRVKAKGRQAARREACPLLKATGTRRAPKRNSPIRNTNFPPSWRGTRRPCAKASGTRDPETPMRVRATLLAALAYFVMPVDVIPDIVAAFGFTDDATVLMAALGLVSSHMKPRHRKAARQALGLPAKDED
ncbi:MAG: hypothetical protein CVT81_15060 [Alphaproteobacteria bacterium HGW-Alphaproteobacteria-3]|nr:MAG: hypothetical protein CVT81_15060 [Alphaproteobacteria bacterium HGW-Alphaproteobacteria-3]